MSDMPMQDPAAVEATRADRQPSPGIAREGRRWTVWSVELFALFAAILILDAAMRPGFALLNATPHVFWLPVVAMAVLYGTPAGIAAALAATALNAWTTPPVSPAMADHYAQSLALWKEPVLWLLGALVLGLHRDRVAEGVRESLARTEAAEEEAAGIAAYAAMLREHIGTLERHIALDMDEPRPRTAERVPVGRSDEVEVEIAAAPRARLDEIADGSAASLQDKISSTARTLVGSASTALWVRKDEGWAAVWDEAFLAEAAHGASAPPVISPDAVSAPVVARSTGEQVGLLILSRLGTSGTDALARATATALASALADHLPALGAAMPRTRQPFLLRPLPDRGGTPWLKSKGSAS